MLHKKQKGEISIENISEIYHQRKITFEKLAGALRKTIHKKHEENKKDKSKSNSKK
jgi:hypothetical protein